MRMNKLFACCVAPLLALSVVGCGFPTSIEGDPNVGCAVMKEGPEVHIRCLFVKIVVNKRPSYDPSPMTPAEEPVPEETATPIEACTATRVEGGVKLSCPTSEAIVYDGSNGVGQTGPAGPSGKDGVSPDPVTGPSGADGDSCSVSDSGLVTCGNTTYQIPAPKNGVDGADGPACSVDTTGLVTCPDGTSVDLAQIEVECAQVGKGKNKKIECTVTP